MNGSTQIQRWLEDSLMCWSDGRASCIHLKATWWRYLCPIEANGTTTFIYVLRPSPWVTLNKMSFWKVLVLAKKKSPCYKTCLFSNDLMNKSFTNKHVVSQSDLLTKPAPKTLKGQYRLHYNNLEVKHRPKRRVWHKGTSKLDACSDGLMSSVESGSCNRGWIIAIERLENSCRCFWNSCR